jgi:hypothetical protein
VQRCEQDDRCHRGYDDEADCHYEPNVARHDQTPEEFAAVGPDTQERIIRPDQPPGSKQKANPRNQFLTLLP